VDNLTNHATAHRSVADYVKDQPLTALAIATTTGFVLGGGVSPRIGLAMLTVIGRLALRNVAAGFITGALAGARDNAKPDRDRMRKPETGDAKS